MGRGWFPVLVLGVLSCGPAVSDEDVSSGDPGIQYANLEDRLLSATEVSFEYEVTAEGAVAVELKGTLHLSRDGTLDLTGTGHFAGQPVELMMRGEAESYEFGNGPDRTTAAQPEALREAILIGLTRMGILHNLARLTGSAPPDHAEGGVREWVTVSAFGPHPEAPYGTSFELTVAGEPAGSALLAVDAEGLPLIRRQTVVFPEGEMRVTETYSQFRITP